MVHVTKVHPEGILVFSDGTRLYSEHEQDCCEYHYLDFEHLSLSDFEGLVFDLSEEKFFNRIDGYGIELTPVKGWSIKIPGYGENNGYYSSDLTLVLDRNGTQTTYDISECQDY